MADTLNIENVRRLVAGQYPADTGLRCITLQIPDDDSYVPVLAGFVSLLSKNWAWTGEPADREERARLWRVAYAATDWEGCMDCDRVNDCIANNPETRGLLNDLINSIAGNGSNYPPGAENTPDGMHKDYSAGTNPDCDKLILSRQCLAFIQTFNKANHDILEKVAVAENVIELAEQIARLPFVNLVTDNVGITAAIDFVEYMVNAVKEEYEAGDTDAYMETLAGKLYCLCEPDCKITLSRFYQMTAQNINELIPKTVSDLLHTLGDILDTLLGLDPSGETMVDLIFWLNGILAKVVSFVTFKYGDRAIQFLLTKAGADESFDWDYEELTCPSEPVCVLADANGFTAPFDTGFVVVSGTTYTINPDGTWFYGIGVSCDALGDPAFGPAPDTLVPAALVGRMVFKIGSGAWFATGDDFILTAGGSGALYASLNDVTTGFTDNSGCININPALL